MADKDLYTWVPEGAQPNGQNEALGVQVDIKNLCYSVFLNKGEEKKLLQNINFHLDPGDMCALMGASGAGKSTLLDLIANRKQIGAWGGDILINQRPRSPFFQS